MDFEIDGKRVELMLVAKSIDKDPIDIDVFFCCPHCGKKMFEDGNFSIYRNDYLSEKTGREVIKFRCSCSENRESQLDISLKK